MILSSFDNKHVGQRGFLLGTGPSINIILDEYGFTSDLLYKEIVVGCKHVCRFFPVDYMVSIDAVYYKQDYNYLIEQKFVKFLPQVHIDGVDLDSDNTVVTLPYNSDVPRNRLPTSFEDLTINDETGIVALKIAYLLGLNPIYMLGCDATTYEGKTHCHTRYRRRKTAPPGRYFYTFLTALKKNNIEVFSCSPISKLNKVIPYVDIRTLEF